MRILLDISYDGHNYIGFQRQLEGKTIQKEIEIVLSKIFNTEIVITASGRTDAGVHALHQFITFTTTKSKIDLGQLKYSLNCMLPNDIHVNDIKEVNEEFHPRRNAINKTYMYLLNMSEANPFYENYRYELKRKLDVDKMIDASKAFLGEHDFKNFTTKEEDLHNFIRRIDDIIIIQNGSEITFKITGNGFMRYMVRMIVGTLIMIGLKKETKDFIEKRLDPSNNRNVVIYKAPANGLYLANVEYKWEEI